MKKAWSPLVPVPRIEALALPIIKEPATQNPRWYKHSNRYAQTYQSRVLTSRGRSRCNALLMIRNLRDFNTSEHRSITPFSQMLACLQRLQCQRSGAPTAN